MPRHALRGATAITGLGLTPQGKVFGNSALGFAVDAVQSPSHAGIARTELDGLSESGTHLGRHGWIVPTPAGEVSATSPLAR